jgi:hypothetical protein
LLPPLLLHLRRLVLLLLLLLQELKGSGWQVFVLGEPLAVRVAAVKVAVLQSRSE